MIITPPCWKTVVGGQPPDLGVEFGNLDLPARLLARSSLPAMMPEIDSWRAANLMLKRMVTGLKRIRVAHRA
jgi:hypothetical protein